MLVMVSIKGVPINMVSIKGVPINNPIFFVATHTLYQVKKMLSQKNSTMKNLHIEFFGCPENIRHENKLIFYIFKNQKIIKYDFFESKNLFLIIRNYLSDNS